MNKAKIMIFILCMTVILTTSFAFKASTFSTHFVYTGSLCSGVCQTKTNGAAISSGIASVAASTVSLSSGCPNVFTTAVID